MQEEQNFTGFYSILCRRYGAQTIPLHDDVIGDVKCNEYLRKLYSRQQSTEVDDNINIIATGTEHVNKSTEMGLVIM